MNSEGALSQNRNLPWNRKPQTSEPAVGRKMETTQESNARLAADAARRRGATIPVSKSVSNEDKLVSAAEERRQAQIEANAEGQRQNVLENIAKRAALKTVTTAARSAIAGATGGASEIAIRAYKNRTYLLIAFVVIIFIIILQIVVAYEVATTLYENKTKLAETVVEVLIDNGSCRELAGKSFGDKALGGLYDPELNDELTNCTAYIFTETDLVRKNGSRLNPAD